MTESTQQPRHTVRVTVSHINRDTSKDPAIVAENLQAELNRPDPIVDDITIDPDGEQTELHLHLSEDTGEITGSELKLLVLDSRGLLKELQYARSVSLEEWAVTITTKE